MIDSRLKPKTTSASCHVPLSSGPRCRAQRIACPTAATRVGASAENVSSPNSPHMANQYADAPRRIFACTRQANPPVSPLVSTPGRRPGPTGAANGWEAASSEPSTARGEPSWFGRSSGQAGCADGAPRAVHRGLLGRGRDPVRLAGRGHPAGPGDAAPVDVGGHRGARRRRHHLGRDVLGDDLPSPQEGRRRDRRPAADPVQPAPRAHLHGHPCGHRGRAVRLHRDRAELRHGRTRPTRTSRSTSPRSSGSGSSPTPTSRARTGSRSAPWARATRSRCWCCRRPRPSSSPSTPTT